MKILNYFAKFSAYIAITLIIVLPVSALTKAPSFSLFAGTYQGTCGLTSLTGEYSRHGQIRIIVDKKGKIKGTAVREMYVQDASGYSEKQSTIILTASGKLNTPVKTKQKFGSIRTEEISARAKFTLSDKTSISGKFFYFKKSGGSNMFLGNGQYGEFLGQCALSQVK